MALAGLAGLVLVAACGSSGASSPELLAPPKPSRRPGPLTPIVSLTAAAGITKGGEPVGASADFAATNPDVVAVVEVGDLGGEGQQTLSITWSTAPPHAAARALFSQRVSVSSGDVAYAAALNPRRIALGLYRIDAVLGREHRTAWFAVDDPDGPLDGPTPAAATAARTAGPARFIEIDDSAGTSGVGTAGPPTDGPTGTVTPPAGAGTVQGCQPAFTSGVSGPAYVNWFGCLGDVIQVTGTVNGQSRVLDTSREPDQVDLPVALDPCDIDPGVGYGKTVVRYTATVVSGPDKGKSATISGPKFVDASELPPSLVPSDYTPALGSQVATGDRILLTFEAHSANGIKSIAVTADPGGTLEQQTYTQRPTRCTTTGSDQILVVRPYTVPADPPPLITITAVTTDFAGRSETFVATYPTEAVWAGTAIGTNSVTQHANYANFGLPGTESAGDGGSVTCTARWTMWLQVNVSKQRAVSGAAQATTGSVNCTNSAGYTKTYPGGVSTFRVTGSYDGDVFMLMFPPAQTNQSYFQGALCLLNSSDTNCSTSTPGTFVLTRTTDSDAEGNLNRTATGTTSRLTTTAQLELPATLSCCFPDAGPLAAATKTPPIFLQ